MMAKTEDKAIICPDLYLINEHKIQISSLN